MSGSVETLLILAAVGFVLVRRWVGEPAQARRMLVLPAGLSLIGLFELSGQVRPSLALLLLGGTTAISVVLGALRGASVRISRRDGIAFVRYRGLTVALWILNLAIKFGADAVLRALDPKGAVTTGNNLLFTLGLGILTEGLVVYYRALRNGHPVRWSQGHDARILAR